MRPSRLSLDIDLEKEGKQVGHILLPWSRNEDAYHRIQIPIAVFKNGKGPTLLLSGGTHGDEYEGQVALCRLIRKLRWEEIQGRVIVIPAANLPAALNDTRLSPLDGGNLNRAFPGDPDGGPTSQIAYFVTTELFSRADCYCDFHAGGASLSYMPLPAVYLTGDADLDRRAIQALKAFGGPSALVLFPATKDERLATTAANAAGGIALAGEFGSAAGISIAGLRILEEGIANMIAHLGISPDAAEKTAVPPQELYTFEDESFSTYAAEDGIFEPVVVLGQEVKPGDLLGLVHNVKFPDRIPWEARFTVAGTVTCLRARAACAVGTFLGHVGRRISEASLGLGSQA